MWPVDRTAVPTTVEGMSSSRRLAAVLSLGALSLGFTACADDPDTQPASGETRATDTLDPSPTQEPSESTGTSEPAGSGQALPVYFVGDGPDGPRLFREFVQATGADPLTEAAGLVDSGGAQDPDYRTLWPGGAIAGAEASDGMLVVRLEGDAFTEAPDGMRKRDARLAIQQLVYTLQGVQQERVPVQLVRESGPQTLFGLDIAEPFKQASPLKVLNHVNITTPEQGATVAQGPLAVSGAANSFEANVICGLAGTESDEGDTPFTAEGWMEDKLFPFSGELDLSAVEPGEHTIFCSTDDPSGGAEGNGPHTDTKDITVE